MPSAIICQVWLEISLTFLGPQVVPSAGGAFLDKHDQPSDVQNNCPQFCWGIKKQVSFSWGTIAKGDFHLGHRSIQNANTNTNDFTDSPTKGFSELIYNCIKITIRLLKIR